MGLRGPKRKKWPDSLVKYIKDNAHIHSDTQIAATLTRTTGKLYTRTMVAYARAHYANIDKRPGRSLPAKERIVKKPVEEKKPE